MTTSSDDSEMQAAIRVGCNTMWPEPECLYPECGCEFAGTRLAKEVQGMRAAILHSRTHRVGQAEEGTAPKGWKLVPVEPTGRMRAAGQWSQFETPSPPVQMCVEAAERAAKIWTAMLAAAPEPK